MKGHVYVSHIQVAQETTEEQIDAMVAELKKRHAKRAFDNRRQRIARPYAHRNLS